MKKLAFAFAVVIGLGFASMGTSEAQAAGPIGFHYAGGGVHVDVGRVHHGGRHYGGHYGGHYDWHDTSHYDWHPGGYTRHGNHYHYTPGHWDRHRTGHWDYHRGGHGCY